MNRTYYEEIAHRLIRDGGITNMGHEVEVPAWKDDGVMKVKYISIDGETEWQY